jgi:hypothetical protein
MCLLLTPAQLIDKLLKNATLSQRIDVLCRAKVANEKRIKMLTEFRLACIEEGWDDWWQDKHERACETLAEIERALATC